MKMALTVAAVLLLPSASAQSGEKYAYVSFPVADGKYHLAGKLMLPEKTPAPAMIIVHGSAGPDARGPSYATALNKAGIATLEIDMWSARGLKGGLDRPKHVGETVPDAYAALNYLSSRSEIAKDKIGVLGFSWGGVVSMLTATRQYAPTDPAANRFFAHVAMYPVCWAYNQVPGYGFRDLSGMPVLIQSGTADEYDAPDSCAKLHESLSDKHKPLVTVKMYPGATHAFDGDASFRFFDPYAFTGKGGDVAVRSDSKVSATSRAAAVRFVQDQLQEK